MKNLITYLIRNEGFFRRFNCKWYVCILRYYFVVLDVPEFDKTQIYF